MRPSATSAEIARRAISRRTGLKHEIVIASGGVVDDHVDAGRGLERADVAALAADQPALQIVGRQRHHRDGALVHELAREPLDRGRDDRLGARGRFLVRVVLDPLDLDGGRRVAPAPRTSSSSFLRACSSVSPAICLELLARLGLRGLGLLDGGVGLLDLAVDALLFLVELAGAALGVALRCFSSSRSLRGERLLALLQLGAARAQLVVELGLALARGLLAVDLGGLA